jgi:hypothetical protein
MTATVVVQEANGAGPTWTTITQGRYCTRDSHNPGDNDPCVVPPSGNNYSYWKHHRLYFSGTFTKINNIRWFTSGNIKTNWNLGTGGMLLVALRDSGDNGCPAGSYEIAAGTQGTTGNYLKDPTNGHDYYKSQTANPTDADTYTSASPLTIDTADYTAEGGSDAVVTQVKIATDAIQGDKPNETLTFRYDEI